MGLPKKIHKELPPMIGIMGNIHSGKSTIADYLHSTYGYTHRGFSDGVYAAAESINPWIKVSHPDVHEERFERLRDIVLRLGWDQAKRTYSEIRELLRVIGCEAGRDIHGEHCWVKKLEKDSKSDDLVAIQGVRFPNEVAFIRSCGGILIWVLSKNEVRPDLRHRSEHMQYSNFADYSVRNDGTRIELYEEIEKVLEMFNQYPLATPPALLPSQR